MAMHGRERKGVSRERGPTPQRRGARKLVIRGETWFWRFGHTLDIRDTRGNGHKVDLASLLECDWDNIERAKWKRNLAVDPSQIVDHIDRRILGYDDAMGFPVSTPWHRHQATVRPDRIAFPGPRGTWQARLTPWMCDIHSPEDVATSARLNDIIGLTTEQWAEIKAADLTAEGTSVDGLWRAELLKPIDQRKDRVRVFLEHPSPSVPTPTMRQLEDYVVKHIVGKAARALG